MVKVLGKGGMATVYLAIQESFQREVALKIMAPSLSDDDNFSERFLHEARIVSRLIHPHIVTVYDVGIENEHHYLSMEYVPGRELKNCLAELSGDEVLRIVSEVASALDHASKKGYVHRDVKPENIMLHEESGRAVLMDFGIAKADDIGSGMTQTGMALGTPYYMSPEQARGHKVDGRADLYSLGIVFYKMLIGSVPFDGDSAVTIGIKHISEPIPQLPTRLSVLQPIMNKLLAKGVEQRYQRGTELVADIAQLNNVGAVIDKSRKQCFNRVKKSSALDLSLSDQAKTILMSEVGGVTEEAKSSSLAVWGLSFISLLSVGLLGGYYSFFGTQFPPSEAQQEVFLERLGFVSKPKLTLEDIMRIKPEVVAERLDPLGAEAASASSIDAVDGKSLLQDLVNDDLAVEVEANDNVVSIKNSEAIVAGVSVFDELLMKAQQLEAQYANGEVEVAALIAIYQALLVEEEGYFEAVDRLSEFKAEQLELIAVALDRGALTTEELAKLDMLLVKALADFPELAESNRYQRFSKKFTKLKLVDQALLAADNSVNDGRWISPKENNARHYYEQVLQLDSGNNKAESGLQAIADHFYLQAETQIQNKQYLEAKKSIRNGLSILTAHTGLELLNERLNVRFTEQQQLKQLFVEAEALVQQGLLFEGEKNAVMTYRKIIAIDSANQKALSGLMVISENLSRQIDGLIQERQLDDAQSLLHAASKSLPEQSHWSILQALIDDLRPVIEVLQLSGAPVGDVAAELPTQFKAGRILYVGFNYKNFVEVTTVLQAILYDGEQTVQIAAVPVIVSGADGEKVFKIKRPVEGFKPGGYQLIILLDNKRIADRSFVVVP